MWAVTFFAIPAIVTARVIARPIVCWLGKHDDAILLAFAFTHADVLAIKVDVFDTRKRRHSIAEPCAIQKAGNRRITVVEGGK